MPSFFDHVRLQWVHPRGRLEAGIDHLAAAWAVYSEGAGLRTRSLDVGV